MGSVFSSPRAACAQCLDRVGTARQSVGLLAWYVLAVAFSVWGIIALASQDPDATAPAALGWIFPLLTTLAHLGVLVTSLAMIPGFVPYPVEPRVAYVVADITVGVMLGLTFGGLASNGAVLLMIVNGLLLLPYGLACYKYYRIIADVQTGARDAVTGDSSYDEYEGGGEEEEYY